MDFKPGDRVKRFWGSEVPGTVTDILPSTSYIQYAVQWDSDFSNAVMASEIALADDRKHLIIGKWKKLMREKGYKWILVGELDDRWQAFFFFENHELIKYRDAHDDYKWVHFWGLN